MISYNDLYELVRKEKFSDALQGLPKNFLEDFSSYINTSREQSNQDDGFFADSVAKSKKQFENSIALFKELILRRKKKLLNLVFVAAETGIMKRDYENMLVSERELFDKLVRAFEEGDKELSKILHTKKDAVADLNRMIIFSQQVDQFVDPNGGLVGPFNSGQLANLDSKIADLFVSSGKAKYVDEIN
jgi:DNA replication initiation complex subunit (GINS family)